MGRGTFLGVIPEIVKPTAYLQMFLKISGSFLVVAKMSQKQTDKYIFNDFSKDRYTNHIIQNYKNHISDGWSSTNYLWDYYH